VPIHSNQTQISPHTELTENFSNFRTNQHSNYFKKKNSITTTRTNERTNERWGCFSSQRLTENFIGWKSSYAIWWRVLKGFLNCQNIHPVSSETTGIERCWLIVIVIVINATLNRRELLIALTSAASESHSGCVSLSRIRNRIESTESQTSF
jgi:hypothetical protein